MRCRKKMVVISLSFVLFVSSVVCRAEIVAPDVRYDESSSEAYLALDRKSETARKGVDVSIFSHPGNITVIDKNEIRRLSNNPTTTISDLLRYTQGVVVRDYLGQGKTVSVDLRGFGETAQQNTVVLVNGRRADNIDIAVVDWTQIPVDSVEKIEILRGPSAALYGDNATGGVINIITSRIPSEKNKLSLSGGSYNSGKINFARSGLLAKDASIFYNLNLGRNFTAGARENSDAVNTDITGNIGYQPASANGRKIFFDFGYHNDTYGLPGALNETDWLAGNYSKSLTPNDEARTSDGYIQGAISLPSQSGEITNEFSVSYRNRISDSYWRAWLMGEERITALYGIGYKIIYNDSLWGNLLGGVEGLYGAQKIKSLDSNDNPIPNADTDLRKNSLAFYISDEIKLLSEKISISAGARYELADYSFLSFGTDEIKISSSAVGYSLGFNYLADEKTSLYLSYGSAFRMPKVDEYYAWGVLNGSILTQMTDSVEIGARRIFSDEISGNINIFRMDTRNEIYYNPATWANENYEKTARTGLECGLNLIPSKDIKIKADYTYTDGKITEGSYKDSVIPAVPYNMASISADLALSKNLDAILLGSYVGERYFISDQKNISPKMPSYLVVNCAFSYKVKSLVKISAGINNIFDEKYAEYGVANITGTTRNYYPAPGRNFFLGMEVVF